MNATIFTEVKEPQLYINFGGRRYRLVADAEIGTTAKRRGRPSKNNNSSDTPRRRGRPPGSTKQ